jgi:hypothetical protein
MRDTYCIVTVIVGLCVLILPGCTSLSVQVDILNSAFWISPQYIDSVTLAKIVDKEQAILDGRFASERAKLKTSVKEGLVMESRKPQPDPKTPRTIEPLLVDAVASDLNKLIDTDYNAAQIRYRAAFDKASQAVNKETAGQVMNEAKSLYGEGLMVIIDLITKLETFLRIQLKLNAEAPLPAAFDAFRKNVQDIRAGLIGGADILDDPRAAAIVYASEEYWTGQSYNRTICSGLLGNTDCAVRMESLGDFTLKGVRLDATKITQATFSVAREAIQIVAAIYGIPVPEAQSAQAAPGDKGSGSQAPVGITSPVKRQRDAETAILQLRLARIAMFEMIVAQSQAISGDNDKSREQAIQSIKNVLDANTKQLDPSPAQ